MRTAVTLAVGLAVALVCVPSAAANADVRLTDGALVINVPNISGNDGDHGIIIEGFKEEAGRDGWRVRQDRLGRPAFVESVEDCRANVLFNDVVCTGPRASAFVTGGDDRDDIFFSETPGGTEVQTVSVVIVIGPFSRTVSLPKVSCQSLTRTEARPARVLLNSGGDFLAVIGSFGTLCGLTFHGDAFLAKLEASGGPGNDAIEGGPAADTLAGDGDNDVLEGKEGNDTLSGGTGADTLEGGGDRDTLRGDANGDRLLARDEGFDNISCGTGVDHVEVDLVDFFKTPTSPRNTNGSDCETFDATPFDDGLPGHAVGRTLKRLSNGTGTIRVACPRTARVSCRGTLTVRLGRAYGRVIARARYTAPLGKQTTVRVALRSARPGARVFVHTVEQGVSKKGPRYSQRLLLVR